MKTDGLVRHLGIYLNAQSVAGEIRLRNLLTRAGVAVFALFLGCIGVSMLSLGAYFTLEPLWGAPWACVAVGAGYLVLACIGLLAARHSKPAAELELADKVGQAAFEVIQDDVRTIQSDIAALTQIVKRPLDSVVPGLLVPAVVTLLRTLRKTGS